MGLSYEIDKNGNRMLKLTLVYYYNFLDGHLTATAFINRIIDWNILQYVNTFVLQ